MWPHDWLLLTSWGAVTSHSRWERWEQFHGRGRGEAGVACTARQRNRRCRIRPRRLGVAARQHGSPVAGHRQMRRTGPQPEAAPLGQTRRCSMAQRPLYPRRPAEIACAPWLSRRRLLLTLPAGGVRLAQRPELLSAARTSSGSCLACPSRLSGSWGPSRRSGRRPVRGPSTRCASAADIRHGSLPGA